MKLLPASLAILVYLLMSSMRAMSTSVGLFAPDRYEGIPEMCLMPMDFGHCRAKVKRYYFDMRRMKCATFYWGGCAGNINNFKSMEDCNRVCLEAFEDTYQDVKGAAVAAVAATKSTYQNKTNTANYANVRNYKQTKPYNTKSLVAPDDGDTGGTTNAKADSAEYDDEQ